MVHEISAGSLEHLRMVVAHSISSDRTEDIEELVAISIGDDVAQTLGKVNREVCRKSAHSVVHVVLELQSCWCREASQHVGLWLIRVSSLACREHGGLGPDEAAGESGS